MARASDPIDIGDETPASFTFDRRKSVNGQVRFFSDADATSGNELPASAGGTRNLIATNTSPAALQEPPNATGNPRQTIYQNAALESDYTGGTLLAAAAGTWHEFLLGDGSTQLTVVAVDLADNAGALSYRIILDVEQGP